MGRIRPVAATVLAMLVAGCVSTEPKGYWRRLDGQPIAGNPQVETDFTTKKTICEGEVAQARLGSMRQPVPEPYEPPATTPAQGLQQMGAAMSQLGETMSYERQRSAALRQIAIGCMARNGYQWMQL